ncbi:MAG: NAD(P)-dependent oxidoreductase [Brevibacterium sp.]
MNIAVVGLGSMGGAMASTLARAGWTVTGFDPSPEARERAKEHGIRTEEDLTSATDHDYVLLSLPNAAIVRATVPVLLSVPSIIGIVDTTTSDPATSRAMASLAGDHGAAFVDAPVSGGRAGAAEGRLNAFLGGEAAAVETCRPVLETLTGGSFHHLGGPGSGNVVKLINNALAAANLASVGEALSIAQAWGVDPAVAAASVSNATGGSRVTSAMYPDWVLSGTFDSGFSMGLMARDAALAVAIAKEVGEDPQILGRTSALWQRSLESLGAGADFSEIARTVAPRLTGSTHTDNHYDDDFKEQA